MIVLIVAVIYALSVWYNRRWLGIAHSKGGVWSSLDADRECIFYTFFPIINTIWGIGFLFSPPRRDGRNYNRLFNVKK